MRVFSYFFPISGRRPEIPVLAGGQGPKSRVEFTGIYSPKDFQEFLCKCSCRNCHEGWAPELARVSLKPLFVAKSPWSL